MDTKKPENSKNNPGKKEDSFSGLNRRRAIKKIIGGSSILLGFPLSAKAWGQPASPFSSGSAPSSGSLSNLSTSGSSQPSMPILTPAPSSAPVCNYIPTGTPTSYTSAPTDAPVAMTPSPVLPPTPSPVVAPTPSPVLPPTPSPVVAPTPSPSSPS